MILFFILLLCGCASHKQPQQASVPPLPAPIETAPQQPEIAVPPRAKILYTETGWASWYGPHYNKRRAANGEIFDMDAMTADRGPVAANRIIALSKAAAQQLDDYRHGTAQVKIEVLESPVPIDSGGRWCVQIGAFKKADEAAQLKEKLVRRYQTAKVLQFTSPIGEEWLRVRVSQDDKKRAEQVKQETETDAGVYLVRLD